MGHNRKFFKNKMVMTNINQFIFSRTQPQKKLQVIKFLSEAELLAINSGAIMRMVKEAGHNMYKSRNKELRISSDRRKGNNWNSVVESVYLVKGKLYVDFYVQYGSTDTNTSEPLETFLHKGEYLGTIEHTDYYGNPQTSYFRYDQSDKARVIRSILEEYVCVKYHDKLKPKEQ